MSRKLRLAYIGWAHSIHMIRWVSWFANRGHEIHLITNKFYPIDGVRIYELQGGKTYVPLNIFDINYKLHLLFTLFKIRKLVKEIAPDIFHLHTLYYPSYLGSLVNFRPIVVMPWNGDIIWKKDCSFLHDLLVKRSLRLADLVPLQTDYLKNRCIELGVDVRKIELVQFGVDMEKFQFRGDIETVKRSLNINTGNVVISTRHITYNVIKIIEAIPIVLEKIPDATFVFIWPNTELDTNPLLRRIKELGVERSVRIVGRVDKHDDLPKYLSIARTFVSVSTFDCFPQTALEAMAMGVLPVMGDIPPIRTYIKSGENGVLVDPLSADSVAKGIIASLILPENERREMVEINYEIIKEKANFNNEMKKMEKLYFQLIEGKKK